MTNQQTATNGNGGGEKVGFISLGCPKALVDSERILTQLRIEGYQITPHYEDAGVVIVNTCGFIDAAKEEMEMEAERVKQELRRDIASMTVSLAGKVLEREIKEEDHKDIINKSLDVLGS